MSRIWFISLVLVALGQNLTRKPRPFAVRELFGWAPDLKDMRVAHRACAMLAQKGFLEPAPAPVGDTRANQIPNRPARWQLTIAGREAARAAQLEAASRKRAETLTEINEARRYPDALAKRVWTLLVARRHITTAEAVEVLGDAGDDVKRLRVYISLLLSSWHTLMPETIKVGAKRVGKGKRYVLEGDVGRLPPEELRNAPKRANAARRAAAQGVNA